MILSTRGKRLFDIVGAIGGLLFFAPPMAAPATFAGAFRRVSRAWRRSSGRDPHATRCIWTAATSRQNVWLDARLIACSFAINVLGKRRVQQRFRRGRP
jgi:hypothetical protein